MVVGKRCKGIHTVIHFPILFFGCAVLVFRLHVLHHFRVILVVQHVLFRRQQHGFLGNDSRLQGTRFGKSKRCLSINLGMPELPVRLHLILRPIVVGGYSLLVAQKKQVFFLGHGAAIHRQKRISA